MKYLSIIIVILLCIIYVQYYLKVPKDMQIIQTNLKTITYNTLSYRYPVVINVGIVNIDELFNTIFKYRYIYKNREDLSPRLKKNLGKYAVFYNNSEEDVNVVVAKRLSDESILAFKRHDTINYLLSELSVYTDELPQLELTQIILHPKTILILPAYYYYESVNNIETYYLYDVLNYCIAKYISLRH